MADATSALIRRLDATIATATLTRFDADASSSLVLSGLDDALVKEGVSLVQRHRLRGCDSLQLAAALRVRQALTDTQVGATFYFVCADHELNLAAQTEGLLVDNPNLQVPTDF